MQKGLLKAGVRNKDNNIAPRYCNKMTKIVGWYVSR